MCCVLRWYPHVGATSDATKRRYRCVDCFRRPDLCYGCVQKYHQRNPFHRILCWDAELGFWDRRTMTDLGFILYPGHGGHKCSLNSREPRPLVVVHGNGVMTMLVSFCRCGQGAAGKEFGGGRNPSAGQPAQRETTPSRAEKPPPGHDEALQLLEIGMYPASWEQPKTAFTQDVLRAFILLSSQANTSAQDFYKFLKRRTDNNSPEEIPVCYF